MFPKFTNPPDASGGTPPYGLNLPSPTEVETTSSLTETASQLGFPNPGQVNALHETRTKSLGYEAARIQQMDVDLGLLCSEQNAQVQAYCRSVPLAQQVQHAGQPGSTPRTEQEVMAWCESAVRGRSALLLRIVGYALVVFAIGLVESLLFNAGLSIVFPPVAGVHHVIGNGFLCGLFLCGVITSVLADQEKDAAKNILYRFVSGAAMLFAIGNGLALLVSFTSDAFGGAHAVSAGGLGAAAGGSHADFWRADRIVSIILGLMVTPIPILNLIGCKLAAKHLFQDCGKLFDMLRHVELKTELDGRRARIRQLEAEMGPRSAELSAKLASPAMATATAVSSIYGPVIAKAEGWLLALQLGREVDGNAFDLPYDIRHGDPKALAERISQLKRATTPQALFDLIVAAQTHPYSGKDYAYAQTICLPDGTAAARGGGVSVAAA